MVRGTRACKPGALLKTDWALLSARNYAGSYYWVVICSAEACSFRPHHPLTALEPQCAPCCTSTTTAPWQLLAPRLQPSSWVRNTASCSWCGPAATSSTDRRRRRPAWPRGTGLRHGETRRSLGAGTAASDPSVGRSSMRSCRYTSYASSTSPSSSSNAPSACRTGCI